MRNTKLLLTVAVVMALAGCRKEDDIPAPAFESLAPVDVVLTLKNSAPQTKTQNYDWLGVKPEPVTVHSSQSLEVKQYVSYDDMVSKTTTTPTLPNGWTQNEVINNTRIDNIHIFAFKSKGDSKVQMHFYNEYANPIEEGLNIYMPNMYIGEYNVFVVANAGRSMKIGGREGRFISIEESDLIKTVSKEGHADVKVFERENDYTVNEVENVIIDLALTDMNDCYVGKPMKYNGTLVFKKYGDLTSDENISINLTPAIARMSFNMTFNPTTVSDIIFNNIQYKSVALQTFIFKDNQTSTLQGTENMFGKVYCREMVENKNKYSKLITSNISNATSDNLLNSSSLWFRGTYKDDKGRQQYVGYIYQINNSKDFSIKPTEDYFYNFEFKDPDFNDDRIFSYTVKPEAFHNGSRYLPDKGTTSRNSILTKIIDVSGRNIRSDVTITCKSQDDKGYYKVYIKKGTDVWEQIVTTQEKPIKIENLVVIPKNELKTFAEQLKIEYVRDGYSSSTPIEIGIHLMTTSPSDNQPAGQYVEFTS